MSGKTSSPLVYAFILVGGRGQEKRGWMDSLKSLRRRDLKSFFFEGFFFQRQRCDSYLKRRRSPRIIHIYVQISLHDDRFVHEYKKLHWFLTLASSIPYLGRYFIRERKNRTALTISGYISIPFFFYFHSFLRLSCIWPPGWYYILLSLHLLSFFLRLPVVSEQQQQVERSKGKLGRLAMGPLRNRIHYSSQLDPLVRCLLSWVCCPNQPESKVVSLSFLLCFNMESKEEDLFFFLS